MNSAVSKECTKCEFLQEIYYVLSLSQRVAEKEISKRILGHQISKYRGGNRSQW